MQTKPQNSIDETLSTALAHHQAGRLGEAAAGYRMILQMHPHHSDALHLLGIIGQQTGQLDYAIDLIKAAIHQNPSASHYLHNLGNTYLQKGLAKRLLNRIARQFF
jgi:tetratricopeptide (TPR) repeat protein